MKKNLCILYVSFILLECFSQQIVKTSKSTNIYDHSFSIIETIEKNKKIQISQYLFEYLNNGKNEYDYYAELINEYEGLKIRANDLIPEITDDIFDADILTKPGNVYFIDDYFQGLKKRNINFKESIKFIVFVYTFLIILLLDINFFGMPVISFLPKYINNFLYYSMFFSIWSLSMYKERKISQKKFTFYILIAYFLTLLIPVINHLKGG